MASGILPFRPVMIRPPNPTTDDRKPAPPRKWWSPIFGFSSEPDYLGPVDHKIISVSSQEPKPATARFAPGTFTEEKARQLRRMTCDAASFHDTMYHSAIASRLASDFSDQTTAAA